MQESTTETLSSKSNYEPYLHPQGLWRIRNIKSGPAPKELDGEYLSEKQAWYAISCYHNAAEYKEATKRPYHKSRKPKEVNG